MAGIDNNTIVMLNGKLEDCSLTPKSITNNGVSTTNEGKFGDGYIIDTDKILNFDANISNEFTVEWFEFRTSKVGDQYILSSNNTKSSSKNIFMIGYTGTANDNVQFYYGNGSSWVSNGTIGTVKLSQWVHRALTYKDNNLKFYEDGSLVSTFTVNSLTLSTLYLGGAWSSTSSTNNIKIDEFRVSDICRYEGNFEVPTKQFTVNSPDINIVSQSRNIINFNLSNYQDFTVSDVKIYVNDVIKQTYISSYDNMIFNIQEDDIYIEGDNVIKIVVNYDDKQIEKQIIHKIYVSKKESLKRVMDEFEKISLMDLSNVDVKLYNELPNEVKNGQLAILCDNTDLEIILSSKEADAKDNCVFCYIASIDEEKDPFAIKNVNLYFKYAHKIVNNIKSNLVACVGVDNEWVQVIDNNLVFYDNGQYPCYETKGEKLEKVSSKSPLAVTEEDSSILIKGSSSASATATAILSSINAIDLTNYSYLKVQIADRSISGIATFARIDISTSRTSTSSSDTVAFSLINGDGIISLNVSNITSSAYCRVMISFSSSLSNPASVQFRIKKMWVE